LASLQRCLLALVLPLVSCYCRKSERFGVKHRFTDISDLPCWWNFRQQPPPIGWRARWPRVWVTPTTQSHWNQIGCNNPRPSTTTGIPPSRHFHPLSASIWSNGPTLCQQHFIQLLGFWQSDSVLLCYLTCTSRTSYARLCWRHGRTWKLCPLPHTKQYLNYDIKNSFLSRIYSAPIHDKPTHKHVSQPPMVGCLEVKGALEETDGWAETGVSCEQWPMTWFSPDTIFWSVKVSDANWLVWQVSSLVKCSRERCNYQGQPISCISF